MLMPLYSFVLRWCYPAAQHLAPSAGGKDIHLAQEKKSYLQSNHIKCMES